MRTWFGCLLMCWIGALECGAQSTATAVPSELSSLAAGEAQRGVYVFYTQSFIDKESKRTSYRGSVYGAIQEFEVSGCALNIKTVIVDKFSGTVGRAPTGELQDTFHYSASLLLTPEIADSLSLLEARPAQLGRNTHSVCADAPSCEFTWLRIQAKRRVIHEISSVNDGQNFDGQVDHFILPLSSASIGRQLIEDIRTLARSGCQ
jgi:hypothetical protein